MNPWAVHAEDLDFLSSNPIATRPDLMECGMQCCWEMLQVEQGIHTWEGLEHGIKI